MARPRKDENEIHKVLKVGIPPRMLNEIDAVVVAGERCAWIRTAISQRLEREKRQAKRTKGKERNGTNG
jgi:metal-responsive CopG/Arc/MetJ family transcriptional regulator